MMDLSWLWSFGSSEKETNDATSSASAPDASPNVTDHGAEEPSKSNPQQDAPPPEMKTTWVAVWNLTSEKVGHVAVQVGGDKLKENEDEPGEYFSLHPSVIPAIGPTIVLPLPATSATTLTEDMQLEGSKNTLPIDSDSNSTLTVIDPVQNATTPPDKILRIEGLDHQAMLACIEQMRKNTEEGTQTYLLLSKVDTLELGLRLINDAPYFVNQDPIDVMIADRNGLLSNQKSKSYTADNCATAAAKIINSGGGSCPINVSNAPWGITPNELARQVESMISDGKHSPASSP